ncbi:MAG: mannonate dehydratase [Beijerinckiaceae bacterium]|nr:mannonate dehydratase [Beijerinckiaceae bacterium]
MRQAWRWFGPDDMVSLDDIRQSGASEIVTALHHVPNGVAWTYEAVRERQALIEESAPGRTQLRWAIVESIPVPDDVKRHGARAKASIGAWIASMEAVAKAGIRTICYNFMPVVDWTRTHLEWELSNGATALRFSHMHFAAFDMFILERPGADADYSERERAEAKAIHDAMTPAEVDRIIMTIASALPGSTTDPLSIPAFRERLKLYAGIDAAKLRQHLIEFLQVVTPVADKLGVKLTLHPDDPPRPLFGLPRIASSAADYQALFDSVPAPSNGICLCTGSLGVSPDNDLPAMARQFADRIHFAHLRATKREADGRSFFEADHLDGDVDMIAVLEALLEEDRRRPETEKIPFRPDHGHRMLDDLDKGGNPGYSAIGRLKGLAELRGAIRVLERIEAARAN